MPSRTITPVKIAVIALPLLAVGAAVFILWNPSKVETTPSERENLFAEARQRASQLGEPWPANERQLVLRFWQAIAEGDLDTATILCPGSKADDFSTYMQFRPRPATAVGNPEPHPTQPGVVLVPARVPFPGMPNKTIKLAILKIADGRLAIDGQHSI